MITKKFTFMVSNRRKCIANLRTQPMHLREDFGKYRTQKVKNVIVISNIKFSIKNLFNEIANEQDFVKLTGGLDNVEYGNDEII